MYDSSVVENTVNEILTVSATDEDATINNAAIQYTFSGMHVHVHSIVVIMYVHIVDDVRYPGTFSVDPTTGVIRNLIQLVGKIIIYVNIICHWVNFDLKVKGIIMLSN